MSSLSSWSVVDEDEEEDGDGWIQSDEKVSKPSLVPPKVPAKSKEMDREMMHAQQHHRLLELERAQQQDMDMSADRPPIPLSESPSVPPPSRKRGREKSVPAPKLTIKDIFGQAGEEAPLDSDPEDEPDESGGIKRKKSLVWSRILMKQMKIRDLLPYWNVLIRDRFERPLDTYDPIYWRRLFLLARLMEKQMIGKDTHAVDIIQEYYQKEESLPFHEQCGRWIALHYPQTYLHTEACGPYSLASQINFLRVFYMHQLCVCEEADETIDTRFLKRKTEFGRQWSTSGGRPKMFGPHVGSSHPEVDNSQFNSKMSQQDGLAYTLRHAKLTLPQRYWLSEFMDRFHTYIKTSMYPPTTEWTDTLQYWETQMRELDFMATELFYQEGYLDPTFEPSILWFERYTCWCHWIQLQLYYVYLYPPYLFEVVEADRIHLRQFLETQLQVVESNADAEMQNTVELQHLTGSVIHQYLQKNVEIFADFFFSDFDKASSSLQPSYITGEYFSKGIKSFLAMQFEKQTVITIFKNPTHFLQSYAILKVFDVESMTYFQETQDKAPNLLVDGFCAKYLIPTYTLGTTDHWKLQIWPEEEMHFPTPLVVQIFGQWMIRAIDCSSKSAKWKDKHGISTFPRQGSDGLCGGWILCRDMVDVILSYFYILKYYYNSHLTDLTNLDVTTLIAKYTTQTPTRCLPYDPELMRDCPVFKFASQQQKGQHALMMVAEKRVEMAQEQKIASQQLEQIQDQSYQYLTRKDRLAKKKEQVEAIVKERKEAHPDSVAPPSLPPPPPPPSETLPVASSSSSFRAFSAGPSLQVYNAKAVKEGKQKFTLSSGPPIPTPFTAPKAASPAVTIEDEEEDEDDDILEGLPASETALYHNVLQQVREGRNERSGNPFEPELAPVNMGKEFSALLDRWEMEDEEGEDDDLDVESIMSEHHLD